MVGDLPCKVSIISAYSVQNSFWKVSKWIPSYYKDMDNAQRDSAYVVELFGRCPESVVHGVGFRHHILEKDLL